MKRNLVPEWANTWRIQMVWPEDLYKKEEKVKEITDLFVCFINQLVENGKSVRLISPVKNKVDSIKARFHDPDNPEVIYKTELAKISDIWIRDFAPFYFETREYIAAIKTMYKPSYAYSSTEEKWCARNEEASFYLSDCGINKAELNGYYLLLDGGNLVHNGLGTGIVTNRVLADNPSLFEHEVRDIFRETMGISELFIIPSEPEDDTGHIDGLVRFLDQNTLIVGQYSEKYPEGRIFTDKISEYLKQQGFNVFRLLNSEPGENKYRARGKKHGDRNFENAAGNYLNFLRAGDKIFLPSYNIPEDNKVMDQISNIPYHKSPYSRVIQVREDATALAEFGGVLNCITSHMFETEALFYRPFYDFIPVAKTENTLLCDRIFLAARDESKHNPEDYWNDEVIQVDFRDGKTFAPNNLQKICKYLPVVPLDPESDSGFNYHGHLMLLEPKELRKMWNIFQPASENRH